MKFRCDDPSVVSTMDSSSVDLTQIMEEEDIFLNSDFTIEKDERRKNLMVEIVTAMNVGMDDVYVEMYFAGKPIHRTEKIIKTPKSKNPFYTLETNSLCLVRNISVDAFKASDGLSFSIMKSKKKLLGKVIVDPETLLNGSGERQYFTCSEVAGEPMKNIYLERGLVLRFQCVGQEDVDFYNFFKAHRNESGIFKDKAFLKFPRPRGAFSTGNQQKGPNGELQYRVKPGVDPENVEETKWMNKQQINDMAYRPSRKWVEAGTNGIGKLYFELLACDNIPDLDIASKSDPFCCILCEDAIVETDVIDDCRNPRWMPWTQRAFVFNIKHPSSLLFVGAFDYDKETDFKLHSDDTHDPVGRVALSLCNFQSQTLYTLRYNLLLHDRHPHLEKIPQITFRIRIEWKERSAVFAGLRLPKDHYVSVQEKPHFKVGHFCVNGSNDEQSFSMDTMASYIEELKSHRVAVDYILTAIETIVMWRGHYTIRFGRFGRVDLPLHSIIAFTWGIFLVENFDLLPAFFVFSVAWILLATMELNREVPSRWCRIRPYRAMLQAILHDSPQRTCRSIAPNENIDAICAYNKEMEKKNKEYESFVEVHKHLNVEFLRDVNVDKWATNDRIESKRNRKPQLSTSILLKPILHPIQRRLRDMVERTRLAKSILLWRECYYAFWIVSICLFLSVILIWIPWSFLFRSMGRIIVWVFLGPWMKLIDVWLYCHMKTTEYLTEEKKLEMKVKFLFFWFRRKARKIFSKREDRQKERIIGKVFFGKFMINIPAPKSLNQMNFPLPTSQAEPYDEDSMDVIVPVRKIMGQDLAGDLLPKPKVFA